MPYEIQEVTQSVADINVAFEAFKAANDERLSELESKGAADSVLEEKLTKIEAEITKAQEVADQAVLAAKKAARTVTDESGVVIDLDKKAQEWARKRGHTGDYTNENLQTYKQAFIRYVQKSDVALNHDEIKALSVGSDPDGGYTVYPDMSGRIVQKIFDTSPMRAYASTQTVSSDALEGIYDDDEAGTGWVSETEARNETSTPQLGVWRIPLHELSSSPRATQRLLDDSSVDIEAWLGNKISSRMGRVEAAAFVNGDGVGKPRGFLTYPDGAALRDEVKQFGTGANGAFAAAPNGGDVLIDALYDLKAPYKANAAWFMNRVTMAGVRKIKDSDGAYLWAPGIAAGAPATLLGHEVAPAFEDMPSFSVTGANAIAVGDMSEAYQIADRPGIRVLRDPFSAKPYVILYAVKRVGGGLVNGEAIKLVNFA